MKHSERVSSRAVTVLHEYYRALNVYVMGKYVGPMITSCNQGYAITDGMLRLCASPTSSLQAASISIWCCMESLRSQNGSRRAFLCSEPTLSVATSTWLNSRPSQNQPPSRVLEPVHEHHQLGSAPRTTKCTFVYMTRCWPLSRPEGSPPHG